MLLHITFTGLDGREETLVTTAAHPFFTLEAQSFVDAQDLELDDVFRLASRDTAVVLDITHQRTPEGETFTTYTHSPNCKLAKRRSLNQETTEPVAVNRSGPKLEASAAVNTPTNRYAKLRNCRHVEGL